MREPSGLTQTGASADTVSKWKVFPFSLEERRPLVFYCVEPEVPSCFSFWGHITFQLLIRARVPNNRNLGHINSNFEEYPSTYVSEITKQNLKL